LTTRAASPASPPAARKPLVLAPRKGWQTFNLREFFAYRDLLWILALRDVRVRYKQTLLGILWAIIQPLLTMVIFTVFFAHLAGLKTDGSPPELFYFCGLLPYQFFINAMTNGGNSLILNQTLVTKVYLPRAMIPTAAILAGLVDFACALAVLAVLMLSYRAAPPATIIYLPAFLLLALLASIGIGLFLSALNVEYRDVRYAIPFLTQLWIFITPVLWSTTIFNSVWPRLLVGLNPLSGIVEGFRWCLLGRPAPGATLVVSVLSTLGFLVGGALYFRRVESNFADIV
jgi:lipopolysaccharide transport system permease protein